MDLAFQDQKGFLFYFLQGSVAMECWRGISLFPAYSISTHGRVRRNDNDQVLARLINQRGFVTVGLSRNGIQYKRSLPILMVNTFLPKPKQETFDTPIHLDGDRLNNHINNLTLTPRWHAIKYYQQFFNRKHQGLNAPIEELDTERIFNNSWEAATTFGLLEMNVIIGVLNNSFVPPTLQRFRIVDN